MFKWLSSERREKRRMLKGLLEIPIDACDAKPSVGHESNVAHRLVMLFSSNLADEDLFCDRVANEAVQLHIERKDVLGAWYIQTISPIPMFVTDAYSPPDVAGTRLHSHIEFIPTIIAAARQRRLRCVCGIGMVSCGFLGNSALRTSYSATGEVVSRLVQALVQLPHEQSWVEDDLIAKVRGFSKAGNTVSIDFMNCNYISV